MTADDIAYGRYRDDVGDFKDDRDYRTNINMYSDELERNDRDYNRGVFESDRDYQTNINMYSDELARDDRDYNFKVNTYNDEKAAKERADFLALLEASGGIPKESGTVGSLSGAETLPEPVSDAEMTQSAGTIKQPSAWTTAVLQNMQYGTDNYTAIIESLKNSGISDLDKASYIYSLTQNGLSDELAMRMFTDIGLNISDYTD